MIDPNNQIGRRIKAARKEKNLTQERLAESINISTNYISEIESKGRIPSFSMLTTICRFLNVSVDDIIFNTDSDYVKKITRQLSLCNEKQLELINSIVEDIIRIGSYE